MEYSSKSARTILPLDVGPISNLDEYYSFVSNQSFKIATEITAETQKQLLLSLREGQLAGETIDELRVRVEKIMGETATTRATRIAKTEGKRASMLADLMIWQQSEFVIGKEWFAQSNNPCGWCRDMNGKILGLDEPYFALGDVHKIQVENKQGELVTKTRNIDYEDIIGPPAHPNCGCVLLPIISNF